MGSVCAGRGVFYGTDPFESRAPDQRFDSAGAFWKSVLRLLRGAQHYCARNEFFCTFDAAWALYAVYGRRRSSVPACGCSGGAERRRDDGASGKTDHAAFGTTLLGRVSWDHRDCFGGDAGDCAVFCVWKSENVGSEPALPDGRRRDCAAVFHAGGNVTSDAVGRQPVFFMYRKRSVRRMLTEDGRCAALWKTGCRRKVYPFLIFNSRLVYCILGGMQ